MNRRTKAAIAFCIPFAIVGIGYAVWMLITIVKPPMWTVWLSWAAFQGGLLVYGVLGRD